MDKVVSDAAAAVADIPDGASLAVGGFGLCGIPSALVKALHEQGTSDLTVASNNCGVDDWGLGILLSDKKIAKIIASYVGENKEFERQYLHGELEVELTPQGTLAEKMRSGGAGIAGFYTLAGSGTQIAEGGLPLRYDSDGNVVKTSPPKDTRTFEVDGEAKPYVLEEALRCDFGLVRAWKGDRHGNLVFRQAARNFNPPAAMSGKITIAEVEELVEPGDIDPDEVHLPGIFVQRVVALSPEEVGDKRIERRTVRAADSEPDTDREKAGTESATEGAERRTVRAADSDSAKEK